MPQQSAEVVQRKQVELHRFLSTTLQVSAKYKYRLHEPAETFTFLLNNSFTHCLLSDKVIVEHNQLSLVLRCGDISKMVLLKKKINFKNINWKIQKGDTQRGQSAKKKRLD